MNCCINTLFVLGFAGLTALAGCADDGNSPSGTDTDSDVDAGPDTEAEAAAVESQVEEILAGLTLDEKIGQMVQGEFQDVNTGEVRAKCYGSLFSGGGAPPVGPGTSPESVAAIVDEIQTAIVEGDDSCGIPIFYGVDAVHGNASVPGSTVFPHNIGLGAAGDADLVQRIGRATAMECRGAGINLNFAPQISVIRDERWGRSFEGFGETSEINAEMGAAYVRGLQGNGNLKDPGAMAATAKHYVGDGGTLNGLNLGTSEFGEETLRAIHLPPFEAALDANVAFVMPSYHQWKRNGTTYEMTTDRWSLTDLLVDEFGFDGVRLSDYDGIARAGGAPEEYTADKVALAVNAGIDMAMIAMNLEPNWGSPGIADFMAGVSAIAADDEARIDDAVRRILRIKVRMGLFENPYSNPELRAEIGSTEHMDLAREAVQKSLVLLKNENDVLPLSKDDNVSVVGTWADSMGAQAGGWTVSWQGSMSYTKTQIKGETILEGIETVGGTDHVFYHASTVSDSGDKVVVVIGELPYAEGAGDHHSTDSFATNPPASVLLSEQPEYGVLTAALEGDKPVILVLLSGRPLIIEETLLDQLDAVVAAWLPGSRGIGVADVLYGDAAPSAKLTHTWPATFEQIPINVNKQDDEPGLDAADAKPLFPLGYGLTF